MIVSVEISYYPLIEDYNKPIDNFIRKIDNPGITLNTGTMSTVVTGDYVEVMQLLTQAMGDLMNDYPSVFNLKISNSCIIKPG
jgi:uncharacterized protein YqgV (UPF0045/DUF77 family)